MLGITGSDVSYDNSSSGLSSTTTQAAIDELSSINSGVIPIPGTPPADPFEDALFDDSCSALFIKDASGNVEILEEC